MADFIQYDSSLHNLRGCLGKKTTENSNIINFKKINITEMVYKSHIFVI